MFESDQNEPHDELAELAQSTPAEPENAPESPEASQEPSAETEPQELSTFESEADEEPIEGGPPQPPRRKGGMGLAVLAFAIVAAFVAFLLFANRPKQPDAPPPGDLGPGVSAASGLRGHLVIQWEGDAKTGKLQYKLRLEPIGPQQQDGFALVTARPPLPMYVNIRVLDANSFAMCGKQIVFRFDPSKLPAQNSPPPQPTSKKVDAIQAAADRTAARQAELAQMQAAEVARERGKDMFEDEAGSDGMIHAVSSEGYLPCSPDQVKNAYLWDFSTNFPTQVEQAALLNPHAAVNQHERESADIPHAGKGKAPKKPTSAFFIQGDDRVTAFDIASGLLEADEGKSFIVTAKNEQRTAAHWASNYSLIHYRCDQNGTCALSAAGGQAEVHAKMSE